MTTPLTGPQTTPTPQPTTAPPPFPTTSELRQAMPDTTPDAEPETPTTAARDAFPAPLTTPTQTPAQPPTQIEMQAEPQPESSARAESRPLARSFSSRSNSTGRAAGPLAAARELLTRRPYAFAALLTILLLIGNIAVLPGFAAPSNWASVLADFAPLAIAAMASTPSILSGGGGIDISIGPLLTVVNIVIVADLLPKGLSSPLAVVPICLAIGAAIGGVNGFLVAVLRFQPVVATLAANIILTGLATQLQGDSVPQGSRAWTRHLAASFGPVPGALFTIGAPLLIWFLLGRTPYLKALYAVGGDDAAAFSAGVNVTVVRIAAYATGGLFAAIAGLSLMAVISEGQASLAPQYTLLAIAAVALGGTALSGGRGSLVGSLLGAGAIYLINNLLSEAGVSGLWSDAVYGAVLLCAVVVGAALTTSRKNSRGRIA